MYKLVSFLTMVPNTEKNVFNVFLQLTAKRVLHSYTRFFNSASTVLAFLILNTRINFYWSHATVSMALFTCASEQKS